MSKGIIRLFIHIPWGVLIVASVWLNTKVPGAWPLPFMLSGMFIFYERNEDRWIFDQAWKDVKGVLWGMGLSAALWLYLVVVGG